MPLLLLYYVDRVHSAVCIHMLAYLTVTIASHVIANFVLLV
jgi:hypothetical protein